MVARHKHNIALQAAYISKIVFRFKLEVQYFFNYLRTQEIRKVKSLMFVIFC